MFSEIDRVKLHFKYCALFLALCIVEIATDRWTNQPNFTTYLSNAATMTSLFLGLVAIFYSFVSNNGLSQSLGSINTVSSEVRESKEQIGLYVELTKAATHAGSENVIRLEGISSDVTANLSSLTETLQVVSEQNATLQALVAQLPRRIDQLESKFGDVTKAFGEKPISPQDPPGEGLDDSTVQRFMAISSLNGNLLCYAVVLAHRNGKNLSIADVATAMSSPDPGRLTGFMDCMHAVDLLTYKTVKGRVGEFEIQEVHPYLEDNVREYVVEYLETSFQEQPDSKKKWLKRLDNLDRLFSV